MPPSTGRYDKPPRPFIERETPQLSIWQELDEPDETREVISAPQVVEGLDWSRKKYTTYYSVPVKARNIVFGYLSVNNSVDGAIGGAQRATILAMARVFALAMALCSKPKELLARDASINPHSYLEELTEVSTNSTELSPE